MADRLRSPLTRPGMSPHTDMMTRGAGRKGSPLNTDLLWQSRANHHHGGGGSADGNHSSPEAPSSPHHREGMRHIVPRPPTTATPSARPVARARPLNVALDLFDARGTPAMATRGLRSAGRGMMPSSAAGARSMLGSRQQTAGHRGGAGASSLCCAHDGEFGDHAATIPLIVEDGWGNIAGMLPTIERTVALGSGRRQRK